MRNWKEHFELATHVTDWPLITPLGVSYLLFVTSAIGFIVARHRVGLEIERAKTRHPSRLGVYLTLEGEKK